jgi:hypothetical protein
MNLTHIVWKLQIFICFFRDLKMSFSSDEVNFLVYRYLQVRVNMFFVYLCSIVLCVSIGNISIGIILILRAETLNVSAHFSVREYLLSEITGTFLPIICKHCVSEFRSRG